MHFALRHPGPSVSISADQDASVGTIASGLVSFPLFHAAWLFAAGILIASRFWLQPGWLLVTAALIAALGIASTVRAPRIAWLPLAVLWLLLGAWCAEMEPHPASSVALNNLSDGLLRTVEGTVVDVGPMRTESEQNIGESTITALSQRVDLRVERVEVVNDEIDALSPVNGGVRLTVRWLDGAANGNGIQGFHCGERIRAVVRLLPPEVYRDPGVWSRADYLVGQGITSTGTVAIDRVERIAGSEGGTFACRLANWQHATTARLLALPAKSRNVPPALRLSEDDAAMLAAMVAGDRTYLTQSLRVGFERTGSFHMLVVSGFHLAVVAGCILWIARKLRLPRIPATVLTIGGAFAYALFTGFATPAQRSLWMITLYLLGRLVYRERSPLNTIGFASLCLLAVSPRSLFDSSLQMTLLAVIAVAGVAAPLLQITIHPLLNATRDLRLVTIDIALPPKVAQFRISLRKIARKLQFASNKWTAWRLFPWMVRFLIRDIELVVVALVVEMAMALPMAVYFHRITLFALPVNLFILPLLAILLPAALVLLLALWVWPAAAVVPAVIVALALHCGVWMVHLFGSMALGNFRIPDRLPWQIAAFCVSLAAAILLAHVALSRARHWQRHAAWIALVFAALAALAPRPVDRPAGALLMEAIDVGQGDSLLVIAPDGRTLLIDGGGFGGGPRESTQDFDIGEEVVSPALWSRGIRHLDAVALTHAHSDHMGGLPAILRNFHPQELWVGENPLTPAYVALLDEAASLRIRVRSLRSGDNFGFGGTQLWVLAPSRDYRPGDEPANNDSLVMRVAYGATSVLLEGDAEASIEQSMLAEPDLASTLLKVGHHGSITSTRPEFLARVAPQWAVISCGLHNRYGHPREEVLEELEEAHVLTFRTDINGASCFVLDGKRTETEECGLR